jgi:hypothetical protein
MEEMLEDAAKHGTRAHTPKINNIDLSYDVSDQARAAPCHFAPRCRSRIKPVFSVG